MCSLETGWRTWRLDWPSRRRQRGDEAIAKFHVWCWSACGSSQATARARPPVALLLHAPPQPTSPNPPITIISLPTGCCPARHSPSGQAQPVPSLDASFLPSCSCPAPHSLHLCYPLAAPCSLQQPLQSFPFWQSWSIFTPPSSLVGKPSFHSVPVAPPLALPLADSHVDAQSPGDTSRKCSASCSLSHAQQPLLSLVPLRLHRAPGQLGLCRRRILGRQAVKRTAVSGNGVGNAL